MKKEHSIKNEKNSNIHYEEVRFFLSPNENKYNLNQKMLVYVIWHMYQYYQYVSDIMYWCMF